MGFFGFSNLLTPSISSAISRAPNTSIPVMLIMRFTSSFIYSVTRMALPASSNMRLRFSPEVRIRLIKDHTSQYIMMTTATQTLLVLS